MSTPKSFLFGRKRLHIKRDCIRDDPAKMFLNTDAAFMFATLMRSPNVPLFDLFESSDEIFGAFKFDDAISGRIQYNLGARSIGHPWTHSTLWPNLFPNSTKKFRAREDEVNMES